MTQQEYEQKKQECWKEFLQKHEISSADGVTADAFITAFDRAYALGKHEKDAEDDRTLKVNRQLFCRLCADADDYINEHLEEDDSDYTYYQGRSDALHELYRGECKDAKGEEMLICDRDVVRMLYDGTDSVKVRQTLESLFGSKCLLDEEVDDDFKVPEPNCKHFKDGKCAHPAVSHIENGKLVKGADCDVSSCEDVEYEPKFKVGDTVRFKYCCTPHRINGLFKMSNSEMLYLVGKVWAKESDLEPYTEPEEDLIPPNSGELESQEADNQSRNLSQSMSKCDKSFDNILKDSFAKERRLNIAVQMIKAMMGCPEIVDRISSAENDSLLDDILHDALHLTDKLIAECEKGGTK